MRKQSTWIGQCSPDRGHTGLQNPVLRLGPLPRTATKTEKGTAFSPVYEGLSDGQAACVLITSSFPLFHLEYETLDDLIPQFQLIVQVYYDSRFNSKPDTMARGNQRDLARAKNEKKKQEDAKVSFLARVFRVRLHTN